MLLSLRAKNCMIFTDVEFSMIANMNDRRSSANVALVHGVPVLKSAMLLGPNNTGKTNFVRMVQMMKAVMLNQKPAIIPNFTSGSSIVEAGISFLDHSREYVFNFRYDAARGEFLYERFQEVLRGRHGNVKYKPLLLRDIRGREFFAEEEDVVTVMKFASRGNLLIYLLDTDSFPKLNHIRETITSFASRIDIVDMNNNPIGRTMEMLKMSDEDSRQVAAFILNAGLLMDDFRYAEENEVRTIYQGLEVEEPVPQENALLQAASLTEMLHLVSVYHGVSVPSIPYDSTGSKKMAALASYVLAALRDGRILIVDELDSSLHVSLTRAIFALFHNELNEKAQLIATVHDISLLDTRQEGQFLNGTPCQASSSLYCFHNITIRSHL